MKDFCKVASHADGHGVCHAPTGFDPTACGNRNLSIIIIDLYSESVVKVCVSTGLP